MDAKDFTEAAERIECFKDNPCNDHDYLLAIAAGVKLLLRAEAEKWAMFDGPREPLNLDSHMPSYKAMFGSEKEG